MKQRKKILIRDLRGQTPEKILRVADFIDFVLLSPLGLDVLIGDVSVSEFSADFPFLLEDWERKYTIPFSVEIFEESLDMAGGWKHVNICTRRFREDNPEIWGLMLWRVRKNFYRNVFKPHAKFLSLWFSMKYIDVLRYQREFSQILATLILAARSDETIDFKIENYEEKTQKKTRREILEDIREKDKKLAVIENYIELILYSSKNALEILLGNVHLSSEDIIAMMERGRYYLPEVISGEADECALLAQFNEFVNMAGGWEHISETARKFQQENPRIWEVLGDFLKMRVDKSRERYTARLGFMVSRHSLAPNEIINYRYNFPHRFSAML